MPESKSKIKIYLDGACHLCSVEGRLLRKLDTKEALEIVNIADPNFDTLNVKDRNYDLFLQAQLPNGEFRQGIDAFVEIYKAVPKMKPLGQLLGLPGVNQLAWVAYFGFAMIRKVLPKRDSCDI